MKIIIIMLVGSDSIKRIKAKKFGINWGLDRRRRRSIIQCLDRRWASQVT
jgi:hypothetical protein